MNSISGPILFLISISIMTGLAQIVMRWGGKSAALQTTHSFLEWLWVSRWWLTGLMASWIGGLGYAWSLRRINLNLAVPIYSGIPYLLSVLGGFILLRESLNGIQIAGAMVILVGMIMLSFH